MTEEPVPLDTPGAAARLPSGSSTLVRSAGVVGVATMTSRVLGLVREQVLAYLFGAGNAMDAFNVAFRIPNLLRDLFAEGAMSAAFIPTFMRRITLGGREDAWRLGNHVMNALLLVTLAIAAVGILAARPLVDLFAADFAGVPGKIDLTVSMTRVIFPFLALVAVAAVCMGMLNSLHRFFVPSFAPAMFNVAVILCAVLLVPVMPAFGQPRIMAIAVAVVLGGLGQVLIQWPALRREGFRYRLELDPREAGLHQVLVLMGPGLVGMAAIQVNLFVNTVLATAQGPGAVSWLNYAFRLVYMPIGLFGVSVATAALPGISGHAARGDLAEMGRTVARGLRLMLMLNVPATAGLVVLALPIVRLLFEHGSFTAGDAVATARALAFYAPGLVGYAVVRLAVPTFYALGDSRTPVAVSIASVGVNVAASVALVPAIGFAALALGPALASLFNAAVLLRLLAGRIGGLGGDRLAATVWKIGAASALMAAAAWAANAVLARAVAGQDLAARLVGVAGSIGVALAVLALAAHVLRIREFREAVLVLRRRLFSRA